MNRDRKKHQYNIDRLDAIITIAVIGDKKCIYVPKHVLQIAHQMLKVRQLDKEIKIKTY